MKLKNKNNIMSLKMIYKYSIVLDDKVFLLKKNKRKLYDM